MEKNAKTTFKGFRHLWIVTILSILFIVFILVLMPYYREYGVLLAGVAGGHLILGLLVLYTGWLITPQKILDKIRKSKPSEYLDFGWSLKWINGFLFASIIMLILAFYAYFAIETAPLLKLILFTFLLLIAVNLFIGNAIIRNSGRKSRLTLPMVNILNHGGNKILDAGCGAGRTTIALADVFKETNITAFDRFDAGYIDDGGKKLLENNLRIANIADRVTIVPGDITQTPFDDNQFDAIVSSFMFDHLRTGKKQALKESYRILKPGGRFLLIILVRGYTAFGVASFMSLLITSRKTWKRWIGEAGFSIVTEGNINEGVYFLFEKKTDKNAANFRFNISPGDSALLHPGPVCCQAG